MPDDGTARLRDRGLGQRRAAGGGPADLRPLPVRCGLRHRALRQDALHRSGPAPRIPEASDHGHLLLRLQLGETGMDPPQGDRGTGLRRGDEQPVHVQCERLHGGRRADRGVAQRPELRRGDPLPRRRIPAGPEGRRGRRSIPALRVLPPPPRTVLAAPGLLEPVRRRRDRPALLSRRPGRPSHDDGPEPERLPRHGAVRPAGRGRALPAPAGLLRPGELHGRQGRRPAGRPRRDRTGGEHGGGLRQRPRRHALRAGRWCRSDVSTSGPAGCP